jgi:F0F1-type ATP synthase assembly protein I
MASSGSRGRGVQGIEKEGVMLWTIAVVLLVLWALGLGTSYTAGGLVHLLPVIAAVVVVFQFIGGRRTVLTAPR